MTKKVKKNKRERLRGKKSLGELFFPLSLFKKKLFKKKKSIQKKERIQREKLRGAFPSSPFLKKIKNK
ncbi:hypothetical protein ['Cynodon dactylon' phytoplasma]|uniref:hypothetical protein n=1 Tax='Cynodon dactylon' phytoplasma TaxID=295320 RepID=UPI0012D14973|nr:hypothetical protein ['Cynodon dactylon' phytoplasma]KAB8122116.1 hypothetical protein F1741_01105 ['Cynodon dactylon' phytoplasma]